MEFVDTHCHIHFEDYGLDAEETFQAAIKDGVTKMILVGCTLADSQRGVAFAAEHDGAWASVGIHPHHAQQYLGDQSAIDQLRQLARAEPTVAIGECGLDYYYDNSPREAQVTLFEQQLQLAHDAKLPVIFHVRDAFDDFFPLLDNFPGINGVVHSFTAGKKVLDKVLQRNLYVGLNGIMTFTKDHAQLEMAKAVPLKNLLLETDAPFLTPKPFRGTICEPKHIVETGRFLAHLRSEPLEEIASATTANAKTLFQLN